MVSQTSLASYLYLIQNREIKDSQEINILMALDYPMTRKEIAEHTNIMYSSVCARTSALIKKGFVYESGIKRNMSGRIATVLWKCQK